MPVNPYVKGGTTDLPVVEGGTGASTASGARTNLSALDETAHDLLDHSGLTGIGDLTTAAHASLDHSTVPMARRNVGTAASAVASGDFAAGDGSHEIFWDASAGTLSGTNGFSIQASGATALTLFTNAVERARITSGGVVQVGDGSLHASYVGGLSQFYSNVAVNVSAESYQSTPAAGGAFVMKRGRGSPSSPATLAQNDAIGYLAWQGVVGGGIGALANFANIGAFADGTVGASDSPGRLVFSTTPDGSDTLVERMRINQAGTLYLGDGTAAAPIVAPFTSQALLVYRNETCAASFYTFSATATSSADLTFARGRGTAASPVIVASGDTIGIIRFAGFDSASTGRIAASISSIVDGTPGSADMPGRLVFSTTLDGTDVPVERVRINNIGTTIIGDGTGNASTVMVTGSTNTPIVTYRNTNSVIRNYAFDGADATANAIISLGRGRGTAATPALVTNNDNLGTISFVGWTAATTLAEGAKIECAVDGTPGVGDMPGRLVFYTTPDGSGTSVERWRITNAGHLLGGADNTYDIGATGATRPRTVYVGTSVVVGSTITVSTNAISGSGNISLNAAASSFVGIGNTSNQAIQIGGSDSATHDATPGVIFIQPSDGVGSGSYVAVYGSDADASQPGGFVDIRGGNGFATGNRAAGDLFVYGGGANGSTVAGPVYCEGGFGGTTAPGGLFEIKGGSTTLASAFGGNVDIQGGGGVGAARAGQLRLGVTNTRSIAIGGGAGTTADGGIEIYPASGFGTNGYVYIFAGDATASTPGAEAQLSGGDAFGGQPAGDTYVYAGNCLAGTGGSAAGNVYIFSGYGRTFASGGVLDLDGGQTDQVAGFGGDVAIRGGLNSVTAANHGRLFLGVTNTRSIEIGASGITTTINGTVSMAGVSGTTTEIALNYAPAGYPAGMWVMHPPGEALYLGAGTIMVEADGVNNRLFGKYAIVAAGNGESLRLSGGDGFTTGAGGQVTVDGGKGGATGNGANATLISGAGGSTSGNSGDTFVRSGAVTSGTVGVVELGVGGASQWRVAATGHFVAVTDNTNDIGATGATRPRTIYARTSFIAQGGTNQLTIADGLVTQSAGSLGISTTSGNVTLSTTTTGDVNITPIEGFDVAAGTTVAINSTGGALNLGNDGDAFAINVGTGAAARTITIGNTTGATGIVLNTGSGDITVSDATDFVFNTTTGTKFGTATSQKIGFYNAAPVVQQTNVANPTGGATIDAEARTAIDSILSRLETLGLFAA